MSKRPSKKPNRTYIGGQAVLEGVMMRGKRSMATAVRDEDGEIRLETVRLKPQEEKNFFVRLPIIRGMVNFFISMVTGVKTLMRSAEVYGGEEPSKFEKWLSEKFKIDIMDIVIFLGVAIGLGLSVLLFILSPQWITELISRLTPISENSLAFNFIEGGFRILIFVLYILLTSLLKDIRRTYMYHGAEHKTISCFESGKELTVENVRGCSRVHDRCGTTFMFFVMVVSILVFSVANSFLHVSGPLRALVKIALLPIVAGLSYELLKGLAKTDSWVVYPLKLPGLALQHITTREPDDSMIEVAITAFQQVLKMDADESIPTEQFVTARKIQDLKKDVSKILTDAGITDESDAEWIVALTCSVKRSEIENNNNFVSPRKTEEALRIARERATRRPLWYVIGNTEFYGRKFFVDERVLIPRPETEMLVYNAIKCVNSQSRVLDLCTGSGAIAVTIQAEVGCTVDAVDISEGALEVAKKNAEENGAKVRFIQSDLFSGVEGKYDLIISNPPYVTTGEISTLDEEVKREPKIALDGGEDGLDFYRKIAAEAENHLESCGVLIMECGMGQAESIAAMLKDYENVEIIDDLNGIQRIVKAVLKREQ